MSVYTSIFRLPKAPKAEEYSISSNSSACAIVQEYCRLSKLAHPSDKELNQIGVILELAQYDPELSSLINEADHLIAYELGLSPDLPIISGKDKYSDNEKSPCLGSKR